MRALSFPLFLTLFLFMVYECIGCHYKYDKKGSLSRHQARCTQFKQEAKKRRTNYSLATTVIIRTEDAPIAGGSKEAGVLSEDVMDYNRDDEVVPGASVGQDVNMVDLMVSLASSPCLSTFEFLY